MNTPFGSNPRRLDPDDAERQRADSNDVDPRRVDPEPHALRDFFALTFLFTWATTAPFVLGVLETTGPSTVLLLAGAFGPTAAALTLTWRAEGRAGVRALLARLTRLRVRLRWYAAALLPIGLAVVGWVVVDATTTGVGRLGAFGGDLAGVSLVVVVPLIVLSGLAGGAVAEELGWRGYALPRLQARLGATAASVVLGIAWTVWHLPLYFVPGVSAGPPFGWYLPRLVAICVLMTWLFNHTRGSVFHAMLFHAAVNGSEALVSGTLSTPFLELRYGQVMTLLTVGAAVVVLAVWGRDLGGVTESGTDGRP